MGIHETIYHYLFNCIRCGLEFCFDYKNELVGTATCPVCEQQNLLPREINKIERITNDNLIGNSK
jgi:transcription elongation factor Elf1